MDQGLGYELTAVLGAPGLLDALARALPGPATAVVLDVDEVALLPVTAELAGSVTPAALCAVVPDRDGRLPGGTREAARRRAGLLTGPESGFRRLTPGLVALVEAGSLRGRLAYVEADYVAREGRQSAAVWQQGHLAIGPLLLGRGETFDPASAPVSLALRALGVSARGRRDEFLVAGLDRHRSTDGWLAS